MKLILVITFIIVASVVSEVIEKPLGNAENQDILNNNTKLENRAKKDGQMMQRVFMGLMLAKSMISVLLMFLSPILKIKDLGLSLVGVIINVSRFIMQLKDRKAEQHMPLKIHHIPAHNIHQYSAPHHEDWQSYGQYSADNQYAYNQPTLGMDWMTSNQYKSFDSPVNTADSYFPKRSDAVNSWSSVPAASNVVQTKIETFSPKLESPTISYLTQNKKISR